MLPKSILNRIQLHHGFVYGAVRLVEKAKRLLLEIEIRPDRKGVAGGYGVDIGQDGAGSSVSLYIPENTGLIRA